MVRTVCCGGLFSGSIYHLFLNICFLWMPTTFIFVWMNGNKRKKEKKKERLNHLSAMEDTTYIGILYREQRVGCFENHFFLLESKWEGKGGEKFQSPPLPLPLLPIPSTKLANCHISLRQWLVWQWLAWRQGVYLPEKRWERSKYEKMR